MTFVIYWEKNSQERGFVSYDNTPAFREEYSPLEFDNASKYSTRKQALKTLEWYVKRGGFGDFRIMEVKD